MLNAGLTCPWLNGVPPLFQGDSTVVGTSKLRNLYERFEEELGRRQERAKAARPKWDPPKTKLDEDPGMKPRATLTDTWLALLQFDVIKAVDSNMVEADEHPGPWVTTNYLFKSLKLVLIQPLGSFDKVTGCFFFP